MIRPDIETLRTGTPIVQNDDWTITAPASPPEIFDWIEHLEAENATLKAHNRQLVEVLEPFFEFSEALGNDIDDYTQITASYAFQESKRKADGGSCFDIALTARAYRNAQKALQAPPAKLALAEAEVLRVAEEWRNSDKVGIESVETLLEAVEAMQEARKDA